MIRKTIEIYESDCYRDGGKRVFKIMLAADTESGARFFMQPDICDYGDNCNACQACVKNVYEKLKADPFFSRD